MVRRNRNVGRPKKIMNVDVKFNAKTKRFLSALFIRVKTKSFGFVKLVSWEAVFGIFIK